jgi:hypothetical protein
VKARLLNDLAAIYVLLAAAEHRAQATPIPAFDTSLNLARNQVVQAARRASSLRQRPDGMLRVQWVAVELVVMGVVAFASAYAAAILLDLPRWLATVTVVAGQVALSVGSLPLIRYLNGRLLSPLPPPGWLGRGPGPDDVAGEEVEVLLARARAMVGQLAVQRLGRMAIPIRSGSAAQWVGRNDALLLHLHHADAHLSGAQWAWTRYGQGVAT